MYILGYKTVYCNSKYQLRNVTFLKIDQICLKPILGNSPFYDDSEKYDIQGSIFDGFLARIILKVKFSHFFTIGFEPLYCDLNNFFKALVSQPKFNQFPSFIPFLKPEALLFNLRY